MDDTLLLTALEAWIDGDNNEAAYIFRQLADELDTGDAYLDTEAVVLTVEGLLANLKE